MHYKSKYTSETQYFAYICMNTHKSPEVDSLGRKFSKASTNLNYNHRQENCNGDEKKRVYMHVLPLFRSASALLL